MLEKIKDAISNSKPLQFSLVLLLGITIGALFYPTKHIEQTIEQKYDKIYQSTTQQYQKMVSSMKEDYNKQLETSKSEKKDLESKIDSLNIQIKDLRSKQKTSYYKLVKPDGTVEIKKFSESEVDESTKVITQVQQEFKEKIDSIENKWETIHKQRVEQLTSEFKAKEEQYQREIAEYKSVKVEDVNAKHAALEIGFNTLANLYMHPSYDLFGPLFLGANFEGNPVTKNNISFGLGLGIRF